MMMKYVGLIFGFLLIGSPVQAAAFTDVDENTEYVEAIGYLAERGIVSGFGDGRFGPEETLTRAELLKILLEADEDFDVNSFDGELDCFADVFGYEWYAPYVCYAKSVGVVEGFGDGSFKANEEVALAGGAKMIVGILQEKYVTLKPFAGYNDLEWYFKYIARLTELQLLPENFDDLDQHIRRAEFAEMVKRLMKSEFGLPSLQLEDLSIVTKPDFLNEQKDIQADDFLSQNLGITIDDIDASISPFEGRVDRLKVRETGTIDIRTEKHKLYTVDFRITDEGGDSYHATYNGYIENEEFNYFKNASIITSIQSPLGHPLRYWSEPVKNYFLSDTSTMAKKVSNNDKTFAAIHSRAKSCDQAQISNAF
jgi:hypothetical protein